MKRIVRSVRTLNERAAELTAAAGQLPNRVAELREAMTATSGQLLNLKSDIQVNVADLKVDREDELGEALAEVAAHAPVFAQAGFLLDAVDLEISPVQRIIVQLVRFREVETLAIQPLIQQHQQQPSVRAILSAILKARAMVATIDIDGLDYHKLVISIGPVPSIRLCWRSDQPEPAASSASSASWQPTPSQPLAGGTSFFGPPLMAATPAEPAPAAAETAAPPPDEPIPPQATPAELPASTTSSTTTTPAAASGPAPASVPAPPPLPQAPTPAAPPPLPLPEDPLARFKVMPALNRPR